MTDLGQRPFLVTSGVLEHRARYDLLCQEEIARLQMVLGAWVSASSQIKLGIWLDAQWSQRSWQRVWNTDAMSRIASSSLPETCQYLGR